MTTTGYSGPSTPAVYLTSEAPVITSFSTSTAAEVSLVYGTHPAGATLEALEGGAWVAFNSNLYMLGNAFVYPAIIKTGANVIQIRATDRFGTVSSASTCTITRANRLLHRATKTTVTLNGTDVTSYASEIQCEEADTDGLIRLGVTLAGYATRATTSDTLAVTVNDGTRAVTRTAKVITVKRTFDNGSRVQRIMAQGEADKLPRLTLSTNFSGATNGAVLRQILKAAGYTTVYVPRGNSYTGPRSVSKANVYEQIVLPVLFAEDWMLWPISSTSAAILPSYFNRFVWWTFNDKHIIRLEETEERAFLVNKARAVYQASEPDLNINYELGEQLPDKSAETEEGSAWFTDDSYSTETELFSADSVLFFGCWGPAINWDRPSRAVLKLKFSNTQNQVGGTTFTYNVDLEVFASKKIAVGYFDLRKYHLPAGTIIYYCYNVQDLAGAYIGNGTRWATIRLTGSEARNFQSLVTQFGVQLSAPQKLATVSASWTPEDDPEDGPQTGDDNGVIYARYDRNNDRVDYTFYLAVEVDDLALNTVTFDLDQATRGTASAAHLLNCSIVTQDNSEFNGNPWIYGVVSHKPNKPIRRVDKLIFKFESSIDLGQTISIAFNVWGRKFIESPGYEDYEDINVEHTNDASVTAYGQVDGGCLVSSFWSSKAQALRRLKKFVDARAVPTKREELLVPGSSEIRAGQLLRVFSIANDGAYNHYYRVIAASPDKDMTKIDAIRGISVAFDDDAAESVAPDVAVDLSDTIKELAPALKTLQFGKVAANKYRGMFRVDLEDGQSIQHVASRVAGVKSGDRVAVVQSGDGAWMIVEIVTPSTNNVDLEEELKPEDELIDDETAEKIIDDSIPGADELREGTQDANNRTGADRPIPNFITVQKLTTNPADDDGEIPYKGVVFQLKLSHDVYCYKTSSTTADNVTGFVYCTMNGNNVGLKGQRISAGLYEFTPQIDFDLDAKVVFGMQPIAYDHPAHVGFRGTERVLGMRNGQASMATGFRFSQEFKVEPEFKVVSVTVHGPNERVVTFQGTPFADDAADGSKYFMVPVGEE